MLGNSEKKTRLGMGKGYILFWPSRNAEPQKFNFIEGRLEGIETHVGTVNGQQTQFFDFNISDGNEQYRLSVMNVNSAADIIRCMYGIQDFRNGKIRIDVRPKVSGDRVYTNVYVSFNGKDYRWAIDVPKEESITLSSGKVVKDDTALRNALLRLIDEINARCFSPAPEESPAPAEPYQEDLPDDGYYGGFSGPSDF